jgi:hypothetical protein
LITPNVAKKISITLNQDMPHGFQPRGILIFWLIVKPANRSQVILFGIYKLF